ncbi:hypothetical protein [Ruegeria arenilitoris]|uniref:hypothetical protein n=1 Tax=Ruegeria arenilitoris TaxID=1173585 RepID=UPI0014808A1E|nr:hypothetical protein [Ruegeria arenilitoris]
MHTRRRGRQIRYYVSNRLISGGTDPQGWRLPAMALEREVASAIARHIDKQASDHRICATPDLHRNNAFGAKARPLARRLSQGVPDLLHEILDKGRIRKNGIVQTP